MVKKRIGDPWMPADEFGRSLPRGLGLNILVPELAPMTEFCRTVLDGRIVYEDEDFGVIDLAGSILLVHADHTYRDHEMAGVFADVELRGIGAEIRVYGIDPDAAEARAREGGHIVLSGAIDKPHGLRECHIVGPSGYIFVPGRALPR